MPSVAGDLMAAGPRLAPLGAADKSPALPALEYEGERRSPVGTTAGSVVPRDFFISVSYPAFETPGYCQSVLSGRFLPSFHQFHLSLALYAPWKSGPLGPRYFL